MKTTRDRAASLGLDDASLAMVHGGDGAILCEIASRVQYAVEKGSWKAFFAPYGPLATRPKEK